MIRLYRDDPWDVDVRDCVQPQLSLLMVHCSLSNNEREGEGHAEMDEHGVVISGERETTVLQRRGVPLSLIISC